MMSQALAKSSHLVSGKSPSSWLSHLYPIYLGKLSYFTNLNSAAIWDDFPKINHDSSEGEQWGRDEIYPDLL